MTQEPLISRYAAALRRVRALSKLRSMVGLPPEADIAPRQWDALLDALQNTEYQLASRLTQRAKILLRSDLRDDRTLRLLVAEIGQVELLMTKAYAFYDTYADLLSQRLMPGLGAWLAGCDVLARDALYRDHPALQIAEPPLVYCDRGFGASIARQDVPLPDGSKNPLPLIQIPYTRLLEKWNLTSVLHEAGHEVMVRLGMVALWPEIIREALSRPGIPTQIRHSFGLWMSEIGPDFWTFGCSGLAAAGGIRELMVLPPAMMLHISDTDPHPPPYLRVLLHFEWCRQVWGRGPWDGWEREWLALYGRDRLPKAQHTMLANCQQLLPLVAEAMLHTRLPVLSGRPMTALFDLDQLHPVRLHRIAAQVRTGKMRLKRPPPVGTSRGVPLHKRTQPAEYGAIRLPHGMLVNPIKTFLKPQILSTYGKAKTGIE